MKFTEALNIDQNIIVEMTAENYFSKVIKNKTVENARLLNNRIVTIEPKSNDGRFIPAGDINIVIGSAGGFSDFFKKVYALCKTEQEKNIIVLALNDLIKKIKNPKLCR